MGKTDLGKPRYDFFGKKTGSANGQVYQIVNIPFPKSTQVINHCMNDLHFYEDLEEFFFADDIIATCT